MHRCHKLILLLVLTTLQNFTTVHAIPITEDYLDIPALGRFAQLGCLYDERTDQLRTVSIFKTSEIPPSLITKKQMSDSSDPTIATDSAFTDNFADKCSLLNIDANTALNILTGITEPHGSASILKNDRSRKTSHELSGTFLYKYQTVVESLLTTKSILGPSINQLLLDYNEGTHVVTGIKWGGSVAITFQHTSTSTAIRIGSQNRSEENLRIRNAINAEFKYINSRVNGNGHGNGHGNGKLAPRIRDKMLNLSVAIDSDFPFPNKTQAAEGDIRSCLSKVPALIKILNDGRGTPLEFRLTPLSVFNNYIMLSTPENIRGQIGQKLNDYLISRLTNIFQDFTVSYQRLNDIRLRLYSQPNCLQHATKLKIGATLAALSESKALLQETLKETIVKVSSGSQPSSSLSELAQEFKHSQFSAQNIENTTAEFNDALSKIEFCESVQEMFVGVEYFGMRQDLFLRLVQSADKPVYILFIKTEFIEVDPKSYAESLHLVLKALCRPSLNHVFLVDCDFPQPFCTSINSTVIYEFLNGKLISDDFSQRVQTVGGLLTSALDYLQNQGKSVSASSNATTLMQNVKTEAGNADCTVSVCFNGGTQIGTLGEFKCNCRLGFEGRYCEKQTDSCKSNPCQHNGWCRHGVNSYSCTCPPGFTGIHCESNVDECLEESTCQNGGKCFDEIGGFTCVCPPPYVGRHCQHKLEPCTTEQCKNGTVVCDNSVNKNYLDLICN